MRKPLFRPITVSLLLLATANVRADLDLDTSGVSDIWERKHGFGSQPGSGDIDRDGMTDAQEATAGTNPADPDSKLSAQAEMMDADSFCIQWEGLIGKQYLLWTSPDLSPGSWVLRSTFSGRGALQEAILSLGLQTDFFRIEVVDVDTDEDGLSDWEEAQLGFDATQANSMNLPSDDYSRASAAIVTSDTLSVAVVDGQTSESWPEPGSFVIRRSGGLSAISVQIALSGSAQNGVDYATVITSVQLALGQNAAWVNITPLTDELSEGDETVTLTLQASPDYAVSNAEASLTINDATGTPTAEEAARFLTQATFGPTPALIAEVQALGIEGWIDAQFAQPVSQHQPLLEAIDWAAEGGGPYAHHLMRPWWQNAMQANDPLRQRIGFALSEIMVISDKSALAGTPRGMLNYYDMLLGNAFGNYRTLLEDVSFHPTMGVYLSHRGNQPPDPSQGRFPDENYAREIMQLFSIGLWMLNPDGSLQLDAEQNAIPTYNNTDITNLARVFTGMSWGFGDTSNYWEFFWPEMPDGVDFDANYSLPLILWNGPFTEWRETESGWEQYEVFHHDQDAKTVLGVDLPANDPEAPDADYPANDIGRALDALFNHQNTGPFFGKLLIQRLVTSNPSPEYLSRVASVFADNGSGVRGDMQAVIKAILLDPEARDYEQSNAFTHGMLREPYLRLIGLARAFDAASASGIYEVYWIEDEYGMMPLSSPSVFNFFQPYFQAPGQIKDLGLVAPEFQITNAITGITVPNHFYQVIMYQFNWSDDDDRETFLDFTQPLALVGDTDALIEYLDLSMTYGQMSGYLRELLHFSLTRPDVVNRSDAEKVRLAVYLVAASPEYAVMR